MRKSIAFIMPLGSPLFCGEKSRGTGGAELQQYLFGQALSQKGYDVRFYIKESSLPLVVPLGLKIVQLPMFHFGRAVFLFPLDVLHLLVRLIIDRPQWVVIKSAPQFALPVLLARVFGVRLIMWGQTSTSFDHLVKGEPCLLRMIRTCAIRAATLCIAQTQSQLDCLKRNFRRDGVLIRNIAVPPSLAELSTLDERLAKNYILWVGNATENKRADVFVELARLMPERLFVMAMNSGNEEIWDRMITAEAELKNFVFLRSVPSNEIGSYYAHCDMLVHTAKREGFPNAFLQAWQCGKPVVSVNIDPDDIIRKYELGHCLYYDEGHLEKTAAALAQELKDKIEDFANKGLVARYVKTCAEFVNNYHSSHACADRLCESLGSVR